MKMTWILALAIIAITSANALAYYNPFTDPYEQNKQRSILAVHCNVIAKNTKYADGVNEMIIYPENSYVDENCTTKEEAKSIMHSQFGKQYPLEIKEDERYPLEEKDLIDFNATSITLKVGVSATELNKDIDVKVYSTEFNEISQEAEKVIDYSTKINIKDKKEKAELTLPFGSGKEVHIGKDSTTIFFNGTTGVGHVGEENNYDWDATHDSTNGDSTDLTGDITVGVYRKTSCGGGNFIYKIFLPINTTLLPDGNINITEAVLNVYIDSLSVDEDDGNDFLVIVANTSQSSYNTLTTDDFEECGSVDSPTEVSNQIDMSSDVTVDTYHQFTLTASGINSIKTDDITLLGLREGHDVNDNQLDGQCDFNYVTIDAADDTYPPFLNITYTQVVYNLSIISPTTENPKSVSAGDNFSINFTMQEAGVNLTSGVTNPYVKIGTNDTTIINKTSCIGTLDCSVYTTEASCNNCSQCNWTTGAYEEIQVDYEEFITDLGDWTCTGCARSTSNNQCGASGTSDIGTTAGTDEMYMNIDTTGLDKVRLKFTHYQSSFEAGDCLQIECDDQDIITIGESGCNIAQSDNTAVAYEINITADDCDAFDSSTKISFQGGMNTAFDDSYIDCVNITNITESAEACSAISGGACGSCSLDECDTNCSTAGCSIGSSWQLGYISDGIWQINVSTPANCGASQDLLVRAEYDGNQAESTETEAINCGACSEVLVNTSKTAWTNISCLSNDTMNQSRNWAQYDQNNCGYENETFYEYNTSLACVYDDVLPTFNELVTAGNLNEPSDFGIDTSNYYYRNGTWQEEDFIYIKANITDNKNLSVVILEWKNSTGWYNLTMNDLGNNEYDINMTDQPNYCCYTFNIIFNDTKNNHGAKYNWTYFDYESDWQNSQSSYRKYVGLNGNYEDFSNKQFYIHNATYTFDMRNDRVLKQEQATDGVVTDTGMLYYAQPTDKNEVYCSAFIGSYIGETMTIKNQTINNTYIHIWWGNDVNETYLALFFNDQNELSLATRNQITANKTTSKSNLSVNWAQQQSYFLESRLISGLSRQVYDNIFNLFGIGTLYDSSEYPSIISTLNYSSFIIVNVPPNSTLGTLDSDGDGLNDTEELYVYFTDPLDNDTDQGGMSDYDEVQEEKDPLKSWDDNFVPCCDRIQAGETVECTIYSECEACDAQGNDIHFSGASPVYIAGTIYNYSNIRIDKGCKVRSSDGNGFN